MPGTARRILTRRRDAAVREREKLTHPGCTSFRAKCDSTDSINADAQLMSRAALLLLIVLDAFAPQLTFKAAASETSTCEVPPSAPASGAQDEALGVERLYERLVTLKDEAELVREALQEALKATERSLNRRARPENEPTGSAAVAKTDSGQHGSQLLEFADPGASTGLQTYTEGINRVVSRRLPTWPEFFSFSAAVRTDDQVLCATFIQRTVESQPRFVVLGDRSGRLYFVSPSGTAAAEFATGDSITALLSHQPSSNRTTLIVGQNNGQLRTYSIEQRIDRLPNGREFVAIEDIRPLAIFGEASKDSRPDGMEKVDHLVLIPAGRHGFRYGAAHADGAIRIWRNDGELLQFAKVDGPVRKLMADGGLLFMVLPSGTATLELRTTRNSSPKGAVVQHRKCAGLEGRQIASLALQQSKAVGGHQRYFGVSDSGELLTFGAQLFVQCKVLHTAPSGLPPHGTMVLKALPRTLLLATSTHVGVYNTSGMVSRHGPSGVMAASTQDVAMTAGLMGDTTEQPLLESSASGLVTVSIGRGLVAISQATWLKRDKPQQPPLLAWARPVIVVIVALVAVWHFGNKSRSLPFNTRRPPDVFLEKDAFSRRPSLPAGQRRMTQHAFGAARDVQELAAQLDGAQMDRPTREGRGSARQLMEEVEQALKARRQQRAAADDQPAPA